MVIEKINNFFFSGDDGIRYPHIDQGFIFYFFPIFWCSHNGDCPQEEIAKFGWRWERITLIKKKNITIFWQPIGTHCPNMVIWEIFSLKSNNFGTCHSQKPFLWLKAISKGKKLVMGGNHNKLGEYTTFTLVSHFAHSVTK